MPIVGVVIAFVIAASSALVIRSPLGHDESVYALRGRDLQGGWSNISGAYWPDYRAPGLPILLYLWHFAVGTHVSTSRFLVVLLGAVIVVATWWIGRLLLDEVAGIVAAVLVAASVGFVVTSSTLLADVPGAAFTLVAVGLLASELRGERLRWSLPMIPLLAFVGTTARFGAPIMLIAGLVAVVVRELPRMVRTRAWVLLGQVGTLALSVALTCYLVTFTTLLSLGTESPLEANQRLVDRNGFTASTGFSDLLEVVNPWADGSAKIWSGAVAVLIGVGVLLAVVAALLGRTDRGSVSVLLMAAVASVIGVVVSVGLIVPNYLTLTLPYWALVAGAGWAWPVREFRAMAVDRDRVRQGGTAFAIAIAAVLLLLVAGDAQDTHRRYESEAQALRATAVEAGEALGPKCALVTSYAPQVGYYSKCLIVPLLSVGLDDPLDELLLGRLDAILERDEMTDHELGVFVVEAGKRQPPDEVFDDSNAVSHERLFEHGTPGERRRHTWVQLIEPCVIESSC